MRYTLAIAASAAVLLGSATARAQAHDDVLDPCSTESDIVQCWNREAERADEQLNAAFVALQAKLEGDAVGELKRSQKAWLEFRTAHLAMLSATGRDQRTRRAEVLLCVTIARRQLAVQRLEQLRRLLEPAADDACPI